VVLGFRPADAFNLSAYSNHIAARCHRYTTVWLVCCSMLTSLLLLFSCVSCHFSRLGFCLALSGCHIEVAFLPVHMCSSRFRVFDAALFTGCHTSDQLLSTDSTVSYARDAFYVPLKRSTSTLSTRFAAIMRASCELLQENVEALLGAGRPTRPSSVQMPIASQWKFENLAHQVLRSQPASNY
jgi:hypothetical protein